MTRHVQDETIAPACPPILLDGRSAAAVLGIGRTLFYKLHATGRLGPLPVKLGERSLWARAELERWALAGCPARDDWLRQKRSP